MSVARALKICRAAAGMEQQELANELGVSPSFLSLVESGRRALSSARRAEVCEILGVPEDLFELLAADPEEVSGISHRRMREVSETLLEILFRVRQS